MWRGSGSCAACRYSTIVSSVGERKARSTPPLRRQHLGVGTWSHCCAAGAPLCGLSLVASHLRNSFQPDMSHGAYHNAEARKSAARPETNNDKKCALKAHERVGGGGCCCRCCVCVRCAPARQLNSHTPAARFRARASARALRAREQLRAKTKKAKATPERGAAPHSEVARRKYMGREDAPTPYLSTCRCRASSPPERSDFSLCQGARPSEYEFEWRPNRCRPTLSGRTLVFPPRVIVNRGLRKGCEACD